MLRDEPETVSVRGAVVAGAIAAGALCLIAGSAVMSLTDLLPFSMLTPIVTGAVGMVIGALAGYLFPRPMLGVVGVVLDWLWF